jgi:hypothetical protein
MKFYNLVEEFLTEMARRSASGLQTHIPVSSSVTGLGRSVNKKENKLAFKLVADARKAWKALDTSKTASEAFANGETLYAMLSRIPRQTVEGKIGNKIDTSTGFTIPSIESDELDTEEYVDETAIKAINKLDKIVDKFKINIVNRGDKINRFSKEWHNLFLRFQKLVGNKSTNGVLQDITTASGKVIGGRATTKHPKEGYYALKWNSEPKKWILMYKTRKKGKTGLEKHYLPDVYYTEAERTLSRALENYGKSELPVKWSEGRPLFNKDGTPVLCSWRDVQNVPLDEFFDNVGHHILEKLYKTNPKKFANVEPIFEDIEGKRQHESARKLKR